MLNVDYDEVLNQLGCMDTNASCVGGEKRQTTVRLNDFFFFFLHYLISEAEVCSLSS